MTQTDYLGQGFIGQSNTRRGVNFYIEGQRTNGILPPLLLTSQRGSGKTEMARIIAKNLIDPTTKQTKPWIEINGASVKKVKGLVDNIIIPHVANGKQVTLVWDECHSSESEVKDWMLSVLQPNENNTTTAAHGGEVFEFNFTQFSLIMVSTNPEELSKPLLSRLKRIELEPYSFSDLGDILLKHLKTINLQDNVIEEIIPISRQSPREIVKISKDIQQYCAQNKKDSFGAKEWSDLKSILNIKPLGLTSNEIELLSFLKNRGPQTLTAIGAKLRLDVSTVRKDIEQFLLSENLIKIDGRREITNFGQKLIDSLVPKV